MKFEAGTPYIQFNPVKLTNTSNFLNIALGYRKIIVNVY